tara:strand:+ start:467 stop:670 length:204 start_codon:yes stop_codon:yes gene_type:complete
MYYVKNAIEIVKSGNNDPDLLLMANTTIKQELKKIEPYIIECKIKGFKPLESVNKKYKELNGLHIPK